MAVLPSTGQVPERAMAGESKSCNQPPPNHAICRYRNPAGFVDSLPARVILDDVRFRDKDGVEVDIVIERGARGVAGVEVKASATVREADFGVSASSRRQPAQGSPAEWSRTPEKPRRVLATACLRCRSGRCGRQLPECRAAVCGASRFHPMAAVRPEQ
jgi:hypothetical protein